VSHAGAPWSCARTDLNCAETTPRNKFSVIRASEAGWFFSREEEAAYCPAHVPDWVPAWRAKQAARKFRVQGTQAKLPATARCQGCEAFAEVEEDRDSDEKMTALRARAFEHAKQTGHTVTVGIAQVLVIEPVKETADA
jgi:hypothetical protein